MSLVPVPEDDELSVPEDDELSLAGTWLGPGKQVRAMHPWPDEQVPVAWMTREARPVPGLKWEAFRDECGRMGLTHISMIADALVDNPFWDFWWD
jgi:hypothetical protein